MVEIDILAEYKHSNVVGLLEAYFFDSQLWVSQCAIVNSALVIGVNCAVRDQFSNDLDWITSSHGSCVQKAHCTDVHLPVTIWRAFNKEGKNCSTTGWFCMYVCTFHGVRQAWFHLHALS